MNKYNSEGYLDPTAYEALTAVHKEQRNQKKPYRPLVFLCSPLASDIEGNILKARRYSKFMVDKGAIPLAPHLLFPQFLDEGDKAQRDLGIFFGLVLLGKCEEIWVFGDRSPAGSFASTGMQMEIAKARKRGMIIRFFDENCEEVQPFA